MQLVKISQLCFVFFLFFFFPWAKVDTLNDSLSFDSFLKQVVRLLRVNAFLVTAILAITLACLVHPALALFLLLCSHALCCHDALCRCALTFLFFLVLFSN